MKRYELLYIVDSTIEDAVEEVKKKIEGIVSDKGGEIESFEKIGKKRLAFPINKRHYGIYCLINFKSDSSTIKTLDYQLRLSPTVFRHIILAFTEKQIQLRDRTIHIQKEEAERMRRGGRPFAVDRKEKSKAKDGAEENGNVGEEVDEPVKPADDKESQKPPEKAEVESKQPVAEKVDKASEQPETEKVEKTSEQPVTEKQPEQTTDEKQETDTPADEKQESTKKQLMIQPKKQWSK